MADFLRHVGVDTLFGLPGDDVELLGSLQSIPLRLVMSRDQRNAVFMATGYAMESGRPGVCVLGKGPAVTNALTGLLEARSSSVPVVVVTGGTASERCGTRAFQELDQLAIVRPLVKWAHRVDQPGGLVPALEEAWTAATVGRPGPVYLELPDHLLDRPAVRNRPWYTSVQVAEGYEAAALRGPALDALQASERPVLLVGGGMRHRNGDEVLEQFADHLGAAVFVTASGRGAVSEDHSGFCGLAGLYAPEGTERLWRSCDLLVTIGSRLEETATTGWDDLDLDGKVLQVNVDPMELSTRWTGFRVAGEGAAVVRGWLPALRSRRVDPGWLAMIAGVQRDMRERSAAALRHMSVGDRLHVCEVLAALDEALPGDRVLVQENGLQDMWSYIYPAYSTGARGGCVVPSEQTTLGFGAVAAGGVKLASPHRTVVAWVGDGAFASVSADLPDLDREGIGVLYVVLRNGGLGWLQRQLDNRMGAGSRFAFVHAVERPCAESRWADGSPRSFPVVGKEDLMSKVKQALAVTEEGHPAVLDVPVDLADVSPEILMHIDGAT